MVERKIPYERLGYGRLLKAKELKKITQKGSLQFAIESLGMHAERKIKYGFKKVRRSSKTIGQIS